MFVRPLLLNYETQQRQTGFDVLLTVHLTVNLVINQLDAQNIVL